MAHHTSIGPTPGVASAAGSAAQLARAAGRTSDPSGVRGAERQLSVARTRLNHAESAARSFLKAGPGHGSMAKYRATHHANMRAIRQAGSAIGNATNGVNELKRSGGTLHKRSGTLSVGQFDQVTRVALQRAHLPASWAGSSSLHYVVSHESGYDVSAKNPSSTASGLYQMLYGAGSDALQQSINGLKYIASRYGSPSGAESFWQSHSWY
jgi:hypothetical protein